MFFIDKLFPRMSDKEFGRFRFSSFGVKLNVYEVKSDTLLGAVYEDYDVKSYKTDGGKRSLRMLKRLYRERNIRLREHTKKEKKAMDEKLFGPEPETDGRIVSKVRTLLVLLFSLSLIIASEDNLLVVVLALLLVGLELIVSLYEDKG